MKRIAKGFAKLASASWPLLIAAFPMIFFTCTSAFAATPTPPPAGGGTTIASIASNTSASMGNIATLLEDVSLIAGIGFVMASFFKFHQHKLNPQQVPISQGITLLLIGGGLTIFPALLPVGGKAIAGSGATFGQLSDAGGSQLVNNLNS